MSKDTSVETGSDVDSRGKVVKGDGIRIADCSKPNEESLFDFLKRVEGMRS